MRNNNWSLKVRTLALMLCGCMAIQPVTVFANDETIEESVMEVTQDFDDNDFDSARTALSDVLEENVVMALIYLSDYYDVRETPSVDGKVVGTLESGDTVRITDAAIGEGELWYQVSFVSGGVEQNGYVQKSNLAYSNELLIDWEENAVGFELGNERALVAEEIAQFPVSYQKYLTDLKVAHPNWKFVKMNTGLDWNSVVYNQQQKERSLVQASSHPSWISGYYSGSWSIASEGIVAYYLDPRNYFNETNVFAFEQLTYNASYHNVSAVQNILQSTFMAGAIPNEGMTYAEAFYNIGSSLGVSPFHLACRVYQEQGKGTSPLISGKYAGYEGLYNYFNVGASGASNAAVYKSGLETARKYGWTTRYASLLGGANMIASNYILKRQDTLYLQKFNVDGTYYGLYNHQYMQFVGAPMSESINICKAYKNAGSIDNTFVFKIPVYKNMPEKRVVRPDLSENLSPNLDQLRAFAGRLYSIVLGREADETGLNNWVNTLAYGDRTGASVAGEFVFSEEFKLRNVDNGTFVDILYQSLFDRNADVSGRQSWINMLDNGVSREYVYKGFVDSQEFKMVCSNYGVESGTVWLEEPADKNAGVTMFVYRCYKYALFRESDRDGLNNWCSQLIGGVITPYEVARSFVFSEEYKLKNATNEDYVKMLYGLCFGREADASGFENWMLMLNAGFGRDVVFNEFAGSKEFEIIVNSFFN